MPDPEHDHADQCERGHVDELESKVQLPEDEQGQKHQRCELKQESQLISHEQMTRSTNE